MLVARRTAGARFAVPCSLFPTRLLRTRPPRTSNVRIMAERLEFFHHRLKVKLQLLEERLDLVEVLFEVLFDLIFCRNFLCRNSFGCHGLLLWNNLDSGEAEWPI